MNRCEGDKGKSRPRKMDHNNDGGDQWIFGDTVPWRGLGDCSAKVREVGDERTSGVMADSARDNLPPTTKPRIERDIGAATAHSSEEGEETGETARVLGGNLQLWTAESKVGDERTTKVTADSSEDYPSTAKPRT